MKNEAIEILAEHYPYGSSIYLSERDRLTLIVCLIDIIKQQVAKDADNDSYGYIAAQHLYFLRVDFGVSYAAAYWDFIKKIPGIKLTSSFFMPKGISICGQDIDIQRVIKEIVLSQ